MASRLRRSAAYRIAFFYSAALAVAIVLLGAATYFAADAEFRQQRDSAISEELAELARNGSGPALVAEITDREIAQPTDTFGYALFDAGGRRLAGALATPRPPLGFSRIAFDDPRRGRVMARAEAVGFADGSRLVVAVDSEAVEQIDRTILTVFAAAFIGVIAIGIGGALTLGRYLRGRLSAIGTTARAIAAGAVERRVPVSARRDEFDDVALALNAMLDRIARLLENLRQVSSDVAHDLRTPLVKLRNQLDQLDRDDDAAVRAIAIGDELLRLFASILRIAEVESGSLEAGFTRVDLSGLCRDVADSFQPAIADAGRSLTSDIADGIVISGDRELLAQAVANLLDNGRIHTPAGTRIVLSLVSGHGSVRLTVSDNGPGVVAAERERILQRFYRSEASRTTLGNGLGLSLVAAVAAAHGGEVEVGDNRPGLRIALVLPTRSRRSGA